MTEKNSTETRTRRERSVFEVLNSVDVSARVEKKNGLTYLSWAWAWTEVKKNFPDAVYTVYDNPQGWNYFTDGRTCWVKTGVTIRGLEHIEELPVMDYSNHAIPLDKVTSTDVNKAIQRSLTKACARHGLGLYIYAGEDLPENPQLSEAQDERLSIYLTKNVDYTARLLAAKHYDRVEQFTATDRYKIYRKVFND